MAKLVVGCGYLGHRVASRWRARGEEVFVTTRSDSRLGQFAAAGLHPIRLDVTRPGPWPRPPDIETVLLAVGYDRRAEATIHQVYVDGLRRVLDWLTPPLERVIYVSSTGVYGQTDGEWVDETSPCHPTRAGGRACLAAEQLLAKHPAGRHAIVLRLAGIYGNGRLPRRTYVERGEPIPAVADGWLNLIHVEDAAAAVLAAEHGARPPDTYVVSDGHPVIRRQFYEEMARQLGVPCPPFRAPPGNSTPRARGGGSKRVRNRKLLAELQMALAFPSYREGLADILSSANA
jgi:nucleoside-diphosphate-sugar epimerase